VLDEACDASLLQAIRTADLWLLHLASPDVLTDRLSAFEAQPLLVGTGPHGPLAARAARAVE
jgi:hypothetical protein